MLAFSHRFHGHGALRYVYKNGIAKRGSMMTIKATKNNRRKSPRIAVVVSKKVLKGAVGRNRIRRRMYELFRAEFPLLQPHCDIVCIVTSPEVRLAEHGVLKAELQALLAEAKLYSHHQ